FLIGLERGWRERDAEEGHRTAGLRTFSLIGLMGGIFGALSLDGDRILIAAGFITIGVTLGAFMWREGQFHDNLSATSLVAAMLTFLLGVFAVLGVLSVAAGAGVATVILLAHKEFLHEWLTRVTWVELRSGLLLAAMTFMLLPLLPDRTIDPWNVLNPHSLWLMTVLIAAVSFGGYAIVKLAGPRTGLFLAAVLGGLFASTAVTLSLARLARENDSHVRLLAGGILAAGCAMFLRVLAVTALLNSQLSLAVAPILLVAAGTMGILAFVFASTGNNAGVQDDKNFALKNPFDIVEVLRFGALLAIVLLAVSLARMQFGDSGVLTVAAISGLVDVDAITLSVSRLGEVSPAAVNAILAAVAMNTLAKGVYAWLAGGARLGMLTIGSSGLVFLAAAMAWARLQN
ncbi:MAG TPA: MgtC/SapB family protein, partial [Aestuariivirga sp.]